MRSRIAVLVIAFCAGCSSSSGQRDGITSDTTARATDAELAGDWYDDYGYLLDDLTDAAAAGSTAQDPAALTERCADLGDAAVRALRSPPIPVQELNSIWQDALLAFSRGALRCEVGDHAGATDLFLDGTVDLDRLAGAAQDL